MSQDDIDAAFCAMRGTALDGSDRLPYLYQDGPITELPSTVR
jgi:hypothetical protein